MIDQQPCLFDRLKILRKRRGWTQERCAELLKVPPRTLRAWEQGSRTPRPIIESAIEKFIAENTPPLPEAA